MSKVIICGKELRVAVVNAFGELRENQTNFLLKEYDKPVVFAWDEVQNEFNSRDFKNFPVELLTLLTQNRKGHGKQHCLHKARLKQHNLI